jgi:hypothetical protein
MSTWEPILLDYDCREKGSSMNALLGRISGRDSAKVHGKTVMKCIRKERICQNC